uniref:Uncharacterized protein n=1 Tax=Aquisalinus luteolus TaxID=1566827 RepID=A0A8J3EPA9_9PROT|nr:hypothetical protein GCM10011355_13580 [Aquisalinus luteolus]
MPKRERLDEITMKQGPDSDGKFMWYLFTAHKEGCFSCFFHKDIDLNGHIYKSRFSKLQTGYTS